jgi:hypothetical protein
MAKSKLTTQVLSFLALLTAPLVLATCQEGGGTSNALCMGDVYDATTGRKKDFGVDAAGRKINALLDTSVALVKAAREINDDTLGACKAMAQELAIPAAELAAVAGKTETQVTCQRVKQEIDTLLKANLNVGAKLTVVYTPPACVIDAQYQRTCVQTCEDKQITETELRCKPGKLSGGCSATCMGSCRGTCSAGCTGTCTATCNGKCTLDVTGTCSGKCTGTCNGTCATMGADGKCAGMCTGTCTGKCETTVNGACEGKCEGGCSGSCYGSCSASCSGTCTGGCSVEFQAPKCEEVEVTYTVTECTQSCETQARAQAECTEPQLLVDFQHTFTGEKKAKIDLIIKTLKLGMPKLLKVAHRAGVVIKGSADAYYEALNGLPTAILQSGIQAGACVTSAVQATGQALGSISVSAQVSVEINASATASVTGS